MSNKEITANDFVEQVGPIPPHSVLIFCDLCLPNFLIGIRRPGEEIQWTPRMGRMLRKLRRDHVLDPVTKVTYDLTSGEIFSFTRDDTVLMTVSLSTCPRIHTPGYQIISWSERSGAAVELFYHGRTYKRIPRRRDSPE